jgi:hypothetical protein
MIGIVDIGKEIGVLRQSSDATYVNPKSRALTEVSGRFRRDVDFPPCFRPTAPRARGCENDGKNVAAVAVPKTAETKRNVSLA